MNSECRTEMKENLIQQKSYAFALQIIDIYRKLCKANEFVLSKQLLRSGTSIGANVEEAQAGQSRADFVSKMSIASKEARKRFYPQSTKQVVKQLKVSYYPV